MGLFDRSRRKRDEPEPETAETEVEELEEEESDAPLEGPATWYRTKYLNVLPAGDDVLLHDPERASPIALPTFELDLLAQCTYFAPIEEHAAAAASRTGLPADGVRQRLYELADRGLLVSQQEVIERARTAATAGADTRPTLNRIAVVTSNRPGALERCLRSYSKRYGEEIELVVFDDSTDAGAAGENRRVAEEVAAGARILYAGESEKRQFLADLSHRSGVDADVAKAAIAEFDGCPLHCGSNRNAVLLDAAGGAVLMVDDDTTARAAYPTDATDGLRLSSRFDPWSLNFFGNIDEAVDSVDWQDVDLLAWHRRFLGLSPASCAFGEIARGDPLPLDENGSALNFNEADAALVAAFSQGRGTILVTSVGVTGDSGMAPPLYFLSLEGAARERLLENYEVYRATRSVQRSPDAATISNTRFLMTPHAAFDVRGVLPPFPPVARNADGVFGGALRTCMPESCTAFLPWSVEHRPPEARKANFDEILTFIGRPRANDVLRDIVNGFDPTPGVTDPASRLSALGDYLIALGKMPPADFDGFVRHQITATVGRRIDRLMQMVNYHGGQPKQWADDCTQAANEGLRTLTEDTLIVPDMPGNSPEQRSRRFQRAIHRYGRVIEAWPALLEASKALRVAQQVETREI